MIPTWVIPTLAIGLPVFVVVLYTIMTWGTWHNCRDITRIRPPGSKKMVYKHAIGTQGNGDKLHMLQGHKRDGVTYWQPICRLDTPPSTSCYPMHFDIDRTPVTCKKCRRTLDKIANERRTRTI